ncbi:hypothetical protein VS883_27745, partial [Escherichia coli]
TRFSHPRRPEIVGIRLIPSIKPHARQLDTLFAPTIPARATPARLQPRPETRTSCHAVAGERTRFSHPRRPEIVGIRLIPSIKPHARQLDTLFAP